MQKILIINGPNLNLLGKREPEIYGYLSFKEFLEQLKIKFPQIELSYYQSNVEGEIINELQQKDGKVAGIVFNGAGYTHTSVAIADCLAAIKTPFVEVHISNIHAREEIRSKSLTGKHALGLITGFGIHGYEMALKYLSEKEGF